MTVLIVTIEKLSMEINAKVTQTGDKTIPKWIAKAINHNIMIAQEIADELCIHTSTFSQKRSQKHSNYFTDAEIQQLEIIKNELVKEKINILKSL